jgi:hypothetical protein
MLANHLNAGQRNSNINGIKLSGLKKLTATKSSRGQTLLHFMIDKLYVKNPSLLELENEFPSLSKVCVLSSIVMKKDRENLEKGLADLTKTIEDAAMNGDDLFMDKFSDFKDRADVLTEALCEKFDSAISMYGDACEYLAEDPSKMSHEDFYKLLRDFIDMFKSQRKRAEDTRKRLEAKQKKEEAKKRREESKITRGASTKTEREIKNESKSKEDLLRDRRRRLSMTPSATRTTPKRRVLTGTTINEGSNSEESGSSSSSEDDND